MKTLELLMITMRPSRWWRALVIFLPLVFSGNPLNWVYLLKVCIGFVIFCIITGSINIIDDITDIEKNRKDTLKMTLPIASEELSKNRAEFAIGILLIGAFTAAFFLGTGFGFAAVGYFFLCLSYFLVFERQIILDAVTMGLEACVCALAGMIAVSTPISPWLLLFVFSFSLFMAFADKKRRLLISRDQSQPAGGTEEDKFTELALSLSAMFTLVIYSMYALATFEGMNKGMIFSVPFIAYAVYKIIYSVYSMKSDKQLEKVLTKDIPLWTAVILWALTTSVLFAVL